MVSAAAKSASDKPIVQSIEQLRLKLLDLTARNRFLSYKHTEKARQVRLVDTSLSELLTQLEEANGIRLIPLPDYKPGKDILSEGELSELEQFRLVDATYEAAIEDAGDDEDAINAAEKELLKRFCHERNIEIPKTPRTAAAEYAVSLGINPAYDLPTLTNQSHDQKNKKKQLQTLLFPEIYERRLSRVRDDARTALQELGINMLHIALGFLEWYESETSSKAFLSPLLLVPVGIERNTERQQYIYSIAGLGEEVMSNVTLTERLHADFTITLPTFDADKTIASYFDEVQDAIRYQPKWRIKNFATLGTFNFSKLALYKDLDSGSRPKGYKLEDHPMIKSLLMGSEDRKDVLIQKELPDEAFRLSTKPHIIADADSSQMSAIIEAADGKSLVIEGPPGTGKSQTITNIIASLLAEGKSVLFVAEKAAALEVVKKRLGEAGLGDFCLELHSNKARKIEVHLALQARLDVKRPREVALNKHFSRLTRNAGIIEQYSNDLHKTYSNLDFTIHKLVWMQENLRHQLPEAITEKLDTLIIRDAEVMEEGDLNELSNLISDWHAQWKELLVNESSLSDCPLSFINATEMGAQAQHEMLVALDSSIEVFETFAKAVQEIKNIYADGLSRALTEWSDRLSRLAQLEYLPQHTKLTVKSISAALSVADISSTEATLRERTALEQSVNSSNIGILKYVSENLEKAQVLLGDFTALGLKQEHDFNTLSAFLEDLRFELSELESIHVILEEIRCNVGIVNVSEYSLLQSLSRCHEILKVVDSLVLHSRQTTLMDMANSKQAGKLADDIDLLKSLRESLDDQVEFDLIGDHRQFVQDAKILGSAGAFAFLNSEVRSARKRYTAYAKGRIKRSNAEVAALSTKIAQYLKGLDQLQSGHAEISLLGSLFRGIATDVDLVRSLLEFSARLDADLGSSGNCGSLIADHLRTANVKEIYALKELLQKIDFPKIIIHFERQTASLESAVASLRKRVGEIKNCIKQWSNLTSIKTLAMSEIGDLIALCGRRKDWEAKWLGNHTLMELLPNLEPETQQAASCALAYAAKLRLLCLVSDLETIASIPPEKLHSIICNEVKTAAAAFARLKILLQRIAELSQCSNEVFFGLNTLTLPVKLEKARLAFSSLNAWVKYRSCEAKLKASDLQLLAKHLSDSGLAASPKVALRYVVVRSIIANAREGAPALLHATGTSLNDARNEFAKNDRAFLEQQRLEIKCKLLDRFVPEGVTTGKRSELTECGLIAAELRKQKQHVPLRDLFSRSGRAIQQLMPCFMMSPLSVSQFLPPGAISFDVVIIDEASQMRPEDALGAISRAKQLVVVGDPKQLPPTSFFDRTSDKDDDENEDAVDAESVLGLAIQKFTYRRLLWHYRSRHAGLIAFSNNQFYKDLIVFPSPSADLSGGVKMHYVPGVYRSRMNTDEASVVVDAAVQIMLETPHLSLGIVTLNQAQREIIDTEMQARMLRDSRLQQYDARWKDSLAPFIIKNLESVQGDERDIILISTVYGRNEAGQVIQRFGPINGQFGWRRLNVLFTRAKERIELFTSLTPSDVRVDEKSSEGVKTLRAYLEYAESGILQSGTRTNREPDSDFEISVARVLESRGYQVVPQVGVAGFFIDMAVVDPKNPLRYVVGIECDGATYHSTRSARDRDRLREEVLKGLGWKLIRVWSTDWFSNPGKEADRLVREIDQYEKI